ncbi:MAG: inorganic phosphate transporter [Candidatus Thermoplasmatota archaeon]
MAFTDVTAFMGDHPFITGGILVALLFDFVNGFHDSANAIATVIATKVLTPAKALTMAAFFNFVGPFTFGTAVAAAVGGGILNGKGIPTDLLPIVVFAALTGAIVWNLITWYVGLPSSSSHALVGGLVGAALAASGPLGIIQPTWAEMIGIGKWTVLGALAGVGAGLVAFVVSRSRLPRPLLAPMGIVGAVAMGGLFYATHKLPKWAGDPRVFVEYGLTTLTILFLGLIVGGVLWTITQQRMSLALVPGFALFGACVVLVIVVLMNMLPMTTITKTVLFMVVSPILGFFAAFLLMSLVSWLALRRNPGAVSKTSKRMQLFSSAFYALTHGTNDAQKTMGIIALLVLAAGGVSVAPGAKLPIPSWVILASATAMGLGTLFGGWRIIRTMASRITHLTPIQGFAAETGGGVVLVGMAQAGIPVSTTHAITASIMGVGATKRTSAVSWGMGRRIVGAWILTIPAAAAVGYVSFFILRLALG